MPNDHLQVGQHRIELVRSARRKRISLEITPTGIKLRSPMRTSLRVLRAFADSKESWLDKHHRSLPDVLPPLLPEDGLELRIWEQAVKIKYDYSRAGKGSLDLVANRALSGELVGSETHALLGNNPVLADSPIVENSPIVASNAIVENTPIVASSYSELVVPLGRNSNPQAAAQTKILACLKDQAAQEIARRAKAIAVEMGVSPNKIIAKDYKRRWGSCDRHANLSFNWRLIFAPNTVTDYVIVHELAHIKVFNHSRAFWQIVTAHYPEYRQAKKWLNTHGAELYRLTLK